MNDNTNVELTGQHVDSFYLCITFELNYKKMFDPALSAIQFSQEKYAAQLGRWVLESPFVNCFISPIEVGGC